MAILILAEHDNQTLKPTTLNTITAAANLPGEATVLVAGKGCMAVAEQAKSLSGVSRVMLADNAVYGDGLAENLAGLVEKLAMEFDYILAPASTFGKNVLPRIAALLEVSQVSDVTKIISDDTFMRPIYAGNAMETVQSSDSKKVISIRTTAFEPCDNQNTSCHIDTISEVVDLKLSEFVTLDMTESERPELTQAKIVISGGRGLQSEENFKMIESLADKLGAAIGASRAAVDAGYVPNDYQVGQTGKIVAPDLYIAIGISGAIQHLAGMKDSKVIVAINKDEEAPIFQLADYGLVGDLFEIVPQLIESL